MPTILIEIKIPVWYIIWFDKTSLNNLSLPNEYSTCTE